MLKTTKQLSLLLLFTCSSMFPMTRVARALLIRRTLNQTTSFHSSPIARCPILTALFIAQIDTSAIPDEKISNQAQTEENSYSTTADYHSSSTSCYHENLTPVENFNLSSSDASQEQDRLTLLNNQNQADSHSYVSIKNQEPSSRYSEPEINNWQNKQKDTSDHFPSSATQKGATEQNFAHAVFVLKQEMQQEKYLAIAQSYVSNLTANFALSVKNRAHQLTTYYKSLSHDEVLTEREVLNQKLSSLENEHRSLTCKNSNTSYTLEANTYGLNPESIPYHIQHTWTPKDFQDVARALELKIELEAIKIAAQFCDNIIHKFEQNFTQELKDSSIYTIETEIIPRLTQEQESAQSSISEKEKTFEYYNNALKFNEAKLVPFNKGSISAKIKGFFYPDYSEKTIIRCKELIEKQLKNTSKKLQSLHNSENIIDQKLKQAHRVVEQKYAEQEALQHAQELESCPSDLNKESIILPRDLEKLHEQYQQAPQYLCDGIDGKIFEERKQALQKTIDQNYVQYKQQYHFSPQVAGFLQAHGLQTKDYQTFFGTTLQHQLHCEIHQLFNQMAQQPNKGLFTADVINFADAAHDQNIKEKVSTTAVLLDIGWTLAGIPFGVAQSAIDLATLPPKIVCGIGKAIYFVAETAALNSEEFLSCGPEAEKLRDQRNQLILEKTEQFIQVAKGIGNAIYFAAETMSINDPDVLEYGGLQAQQKWHERNELIKNAISEYLKDKTPHDAVKDTTHLIADFVLIGKMLHAFGHLSAGIARESKGLRSLEGAASLLSEELSVEKVFEEILETTRALESTTPEGLKIQTLVEFMQAESAIAQTANIATKPLNLLIDKVKALGGSIPLDNVDLFNEFKAATLNIMEKINTPLSNSFQKKYGKIRVNNINVSLNLKHIAQSSVTFEKKTGRGVYEIMMELSHEPGTCRAFEKAGLVKIIDVKKLPNGCLEYSLENILNGKPFTKTEFPSHWTIEKITQSALDTYKHGTKNLTKEGKITKQYHIENIDINIILTETLSKISGKVEAANIITILPYKQ